MSKTQLKIGKCERCKDTIIVPIDEDFYCNRWCCFIMTTKRKYGLSYIKSNYIIYGIQRLGNYQIDKTDRDLLKINNDFCPKCNEPFKWSKQLDPKIHIISCPECGYILT